MATEESVIRQRFLDDYASTLRRYLELRSLEARRLAAGPLVRVPCTFCGSVVANFGFARDGFQFKVCAACESIFASPRPPRAILDARSSDSAAAKFWRSEMRPRLRMLRDTAEENLPLVKGAIHHRSEAKVVAVDVGCGDGGLLRKLVGLPEVAAASGIEPDRALASEAQSLGFKVATTTVERAGITGIGLVTCFDLVEHCYDPVGFLSSCARLLAPGGLLVLTAPNAWSFATAALWERSDNIFPPDHLNIPTVMGLTRATQRAGLEVVDARSVGRNELQTLRSATRSDPNVPLLRPVRLLLKLTAEAANKFEETLGIAGLAGRVCVIARSHQAEQRSVRLN